MENEKSTTNSAARQLVATYAFYAQNCEKMMAQLKSFERTRLDTERRNWPDCVLDPDVNRVSGWLEAEGAYLKSFMPGELPVEVVEAGEKYLRAEDELVDYLERLLPDECWSKTRSADHAIWTYMNMASPAGMDWELHGAKIDRLIARKKSVYETNKAVAYRSIMARMAGAEPETAKKSRASVKRLEVKLDRMAQAMVYLAEGEAAHSWDRFRKTRRVKWEQVRTVWLAAEECKSTGEVTTLRALCRRLFRRENMASQVRNGGYPSFQALYTYCHEHELEFPSLSACKSRRNMV